MHQDTGNDQSGQSTAGSNHGLRHAHPTRLDANGWHTKTARNRLATVQRRPGLSKEVAVSGSDVSRSRDTRSQTLLRAFRKAKIDRSPGGFMFEEDEPQKILEIVGLPRRNSASNSRGRSGVAMGFSSINGALSTLPTHHQTVRCLPAANQMLVLGGWRPPLKHGNNGY